MKQVNDFTRRKVTALAVLAMMIFGGAVSAQAQTTAFTYQGRFTDTTAAQPTNGTYTMTFRLFDALTGGNQILDSSTAVTSMVSVVNGIFTVKLDFGAAFTTIGARYLEIQVGSTVLTPRQEITSTPFAMRAANAATADSLATVCVGCVTNAQIAGGIDGAKVSGTVANATTATTAGNVTGVVAIANGGTGSSAQNFVDLTTAQTIGGSKTFTGVLSGDGSGLRNISGANVSGSTALNPQRLATLRWYDVNQATLSSPIAVGGVPRALAFDGTFIYAANYVGNSVTRIRAATGAVESTIVGSRSTALAFDGTFVYAANYDNNNVTRIRAATGVIEGSPIAVGNRPIALVFDGTFVYVANMDSNNVTRIRAATGVIEGSPIAVGNRPIATTFDGTFVYVANLYGSNVTRIRASTGAVEGSPIIVGSSPSALGFDGTFIYVANSNNVTRIRAATGVVEGSPIAVGNSPSAFAFDGTFIYVTNYNSNNVAKIRASTGVVEGNPIAVGNSPSALAFDGTFIYVANAGGGNVMRF